MTATNYALLTVCWGFTTWSHNKSERWALLSPLDKWGNSDSNNSSNLINIPFPVTGRAGHPNPTLPRVKSLVCIFITPGCMPPNTWYSISHSLHTSGLHNWVNLIKKISSKEFNKFKKNQEKQEITVMRYTVAEILPPNANSQGNKENWVAKKTKLSLP